MSAGGREPNLRRGCLAGLLVLILLGSGLVYMWFQVYSKFTPPEELKPYATRESTMALIISKEPAPGPDKRLTEEDLQFYLNSLDSVNTGWRVFDAAWDSTLATRKPEDRDDEFDPLDLDALGVIFFRTNLYARRALVNYLNDRNRSWDQYQWTKARMLAASDITQQELTDTVRRFLDRYNFTLPDEGGEPVSNDLFTRVRGMREKGIDSVEQALVAPYRETILTKGIHSLTQTEEMFYGENE